MEAPKPNQSSTVKTQPPAEPWPSQPRRADRCRATALYLGLAPFYSRRRVGRLDSFTGHHAGQALALFGMLVGGIIIAAASLAIGTYFLIAHYQAYDSLHVADIGNALGAIAAVAWLSSWSVGLICAVRGSTWEIPVVSRLARLRRVLALSRITTLCLFGCLFLLVGMTIHASIMTRSGSVQARAYMLYDDMGFVPRWVFNLGFYRVTRASIDTWGTNSVVVAPLTHASFAGAIRYGTFVFVASHGLDGNIVFSDFRAPIQPTDEIAEFVGPRLRRVYMAACETGTKAAQWEEELAPAHVTTYDRVSAVPEHVYWLWFVAPRVISEMPPLSASPESELATPTNPRN